MLYIVSKLVGRGEICQGHQGKSEICVQYDKKHKNKEKIDTEWKYTKNQGKKHSILKFKMESCADFKRGGILQKCAKYKRDEQYKNEEDFYKH